MSQCVLYTLGGPGGDERPLSNRKYTGRPWADARGSQMGEFPWRMSNLGSFLLKGLFRASQNGLISYFEYSDPCHDLA